jgi:hypothetical protein
VQRHQLRAVEVSDLFLALSTKESRPHSRVASYGGNNNSTTTSPASSFFAFVAGRKEIQTSITIAFFFDHYNTKLGILRIAKL